MAGRTTSLMAYSILEARVETGNLCITVITIFIQVGLREELIVFAELLLD
jgi:hypothetical protein